MNLDNVVQFPGFHSAEQDYVKSLYKPTEQHTVIVNESPVSKNTEKCAGKTRIIEEIERARDQIKSTLLTTVPSVSSIDCSIFEEMQRNHKEILETIKKINCRLDKIETVLKMEATPTTNTDKKEAAVANSNEDDIDLFGSDEDDEENERLKEERVRAYNEKKAHKPVLVAKSNIILDVKPWDDETDMKEMERCVRSIAADGLLWGSSKLVPVGYGIKKLQISCVVEDDKVGTDFLEERITEFEELVQSVDIAAFNKI